MMAREEKSPVILGAKELELYDEMESPVMMNISEGDWWENEDKEIIFGRAKFSPFM